MAQKTAQLKEAIKFAKENGYILAVYKRNGNHYKLYENCYTDDVKGIDENTDITVRIMGSSINFNEFASKDKDFFFLLHNNFNIPNIIPTNRKDKFPE